MLGRFKRPISGVRMLGCVMRWWSPRRGGPPNSWCNHLWLHEDYVLAHNFLLLKKWMIGTIILSSRHSFQYISYQKVFDRIPLNPVIKTIVDFGIFLFYFDNRIIETHENLERKQWANFTFPWYTKTMPAENIFCCMSFYWIIGNWSTGIW